MLIRWFEPHDFTTLALYFCLQAHPTALGGLYFFSTLLLLLSFSPYSQPSSLREKGPAASLARCHAPSSTSRMRSSILILFYRLQAHPTAVGGLYFNLQQITTVHFRLLLNQFTQFKLSPKAIDAIAIKASVGANQ